MLDILGISQGLRFPSFLYKLAWVMGTKLSLIFSSTYSTSFHTTIYIKISWRLKRSTSSYKRIQYHSALHLNYVDEHGHILGISIRFLIVKSNNQVMIEELISGLKETLRRDIKTSIREYVIPHGKWQVKIFSFIKRLY